MRAENNRKKSSGFTLIEVAVALAILGWVLGSAIYLVKQYADERLKMRESFLSNQVAWNQLLEQYRYSQGWRPANQAQDLEVAGQQLQGLKEWYWDMELEPAMGEDLYRYQVKVSSEPEMRAESVLSIYLLNNN